MITTTELTKECKEFFDEVGSKFRELKFGEATKQVKKFFGKLGHDNNCRVGAAGLQGADEGEWLYDLVWNKIDGQGNLIEQVLVLESEWKPNGSVLGAVQFDDDFQKLVQARAKFRVWVTACANNEIVHAHIESCKRQAKVFDGTSKGDYYLFIVFNWRDNKFVVEPFQI